MEVSVGRRWMRVALVAGGVGACGTPWVDEGGEVAHLSAADRSGGSGRLHLDLPVEEGQTALLLTADPEPGYRAIVLSVTSPEREEVFDLDAEWDSGRLKTGARYATDVVSLNWPIIEGDAPLVAGTWKVDLGVVDEDSKYRKGIDVDLDLVFKDDPSFDDGTLTVRIVSAGSVRTDAEAQRALGVARDLWTDLYAQVGIAVEFLEGTTDETALEQPGFGSDASYEAISSATDVGDVTVVFAPTIEGSPDIYGVAGGIPGPLVPTSRSVVTVSAATHAGGDLVFSPLEERILAETLAHEVGHYLGLFHPVETDWAAWDALDDTPECGSQSACVSALGSNVMFPFPVCSQTSCQAQSDLSDLQGLAMNRYTGVR